MADRSRAASITRFPNAANHYAMLALFFAWYNFVRVHSTLKTTPAVAHGLASEPWTIETLLREAATYANAA